MSRLCHIITLSLLLSAAVPQDATAADTDTTPQLNGIVATASEKLALIEFSQPRLLRLQSAILREGEREGDLEVVAISPQTGLVRVKHRGQATELRLGLVQPTGQPTPTLRLEKIGLGPLLQLYQRLAGRTLLRAGGLPKIELDLTSSADSNAALASAIEAGLANQGILIRRDREQFSVVATRKADFDLVTPRLWELAVAIGSPREVGSASGAGPDHETLPAGMINFPQTDLNQALQIFQKLSGRTLLRPTALPASTISLANITPLTRTEVVYAFTAVLALNGISATTTGKDFLLVYPTRETNNVAALLQRKPHGNLASSPTHALLPAGTLNLAASLKDFAPIYEQLAGQSVEIVPSTPAMLLLLKNQTELTRERARYGLDLLLGLNNLAVVAKEPGPGMVIKPLPAVPQR